MADDNLPMLVHLLGIFTGFLGPLILWLVKREDPAVDQHGKVVLNFTLTVLIATVALYVLAGIFMATGIMILAVIPILLSWAVGVAALILLIRGTIGASKGQDVTYPASLTLVK